MSIKTILTLFSAVSAQPTACLDTSQPGWEETYCYDYCAGFGPLWSVSGSPAEICSAQCPEGPATDQGATEDPATGEDQPILSGETCGNNIAVEGWRDFLACPLVCSFPGDLQITAGNCTQPTAEECGCGEEQTQPADAGEGVAKSE